MAKYEVRVVEQTYYEVWDTEFEVLVLCYGTPTAAAQMMHMMNANSDFELYHPAEETSHEDS